MPDPVLIQAYLNKQLVGQSIANVKRSVSDHRPIGFQILIEGNCEPVDLLTGKLQILGRIDDESSVTLNVWAGLVDRIISIQFARQVKQMSDTSFLSFLRDISAVGDNGPRGRLKTALPYIKSDPKDLRLPDAPKKIVMSSFNLCVGDLSATKAITVGYEGHLFLAGGSNSLLEQYRIDPGNLAVLENSVKWIDLISVRQKNLFRSNIRFLQMILPEKSSILPEYYPVSIDIPTPLFNSVMESIRSDYSLSSAFLDTFRLLSDDIDRCHTYRRLDSHLTPYGSYIVFLGILNKIGVKFDSQISFSRQSPIRGDMGEHFSGLKTWEILDTLPLDIFSTQSAGLIQTENHVPEGGGHNGSRCVWINSTAPVPLRVVVFGNSFFEKGSGEGCLSWWMARWFREYHFLWQPEIDYDYVERIKPDIVIAQTIERFLPILPTV
jgi:hypothetical protein